MDLTKPSPVLILGVLLGLISPKAFAQQPPEGESPLSFMKAALDGPAPEPIAIRDKDECVTLTRELRDTPVHAGSTATLASVIGSVAAREKFIADFRERVGIYRLQKKLRASGISEPEMQQYMNDMDEMKSFDPTYRSIADESKVASYIRDEENFLTQLRDPSVATRVAKDGQARVPVNPRYMFRSSDEWGSLGTATAKRLPELVEASEKRLATLRRLSAFHAKHGDENFILQFRTYFDELKYYAQGGQRTGKVSLSNLKEELKQLEKNWETAQTDGSLRSRAPGVGGMPVHLANEYHGAVEREASMTFQLRRITLRRLISFHEKWGDLIPVQTLEDLKAMAGRTLPKAGAGLGIAVGAALTFVVINQTKAKNPYATELALLSPKINPGYLCDQALTAPEVRSALGEAMAISRGYRMLGSPKVDPAKAGKDIGGRREGG